MRKLLSSQGKKKKRLQEMSFCERKKKKNKTEAYHLMTKPEAQNLLKEGGKTYHYCAWERGEERQEQKKSLGVSEGE